MAPNSNKEQDIQSLTDTELIERMKYYRLYAVSNRGDKNALVISGPEMLEEVIRRLTTKPVPTRYPDTTPNKLDVI